MSEEEMTAKKIHSVENLVGVVTNHLPLRKLKVVLRLDICIKKSNPNV